MTRAALCILLCSSTMLSGCNWVIDNFNSTYSEVTTANPLTTEFDVSTAAQRTIDVKQKDYIDPSSMRWTMLNVRETQVPTYVVLVALDSVSKCHKLLIDTGLTTRGIDTNFDIITTVLSALATALTNTSTIHILTAAISISSGFKGIANTDIYGKQAATLIGAEIESTYLAEIKKYIADLQKRIATRAVINPALEVLQISFIHNECNIDKAIADLNAKARKPADDPKPVLIAAADVKPGLMFIDKQSGVTWKVISVSGINVVIQVVNDKRTEPRTIDSILFMANGSI